MVTQSPGHRPIYAKPAVDLRQHDADRLVDLQPPRACGYCGHIVNVAKIMRRRDNSYAYACLGCAVRTDPARATPS